MEGIVREYIEIQEQKAREKEERVCCHTATHNTYGL
jgi:hypothetical protein